MIKFVLKREYPHSRKFAVMGELYFNGRKICDTLEPPTGEHVDEKYGRGFCIPPGTYEIKLTYSFKMKKILPELLDVPKRYGIRIHAGNTDRDTEGCILPGKRDDKNPYLVSRSREALAVVISLIRNAGGVAEIDIN